MNPLILFLGHGSRAEGATQGMQSVAEHLGQQYGLTDLVMCQMEGLGLSLTDAIHAAWDRGVRDILVQPYFLHDGNHLRQDVPEVLEQCRVQYPGLKIHLGRHLGADPALATLVHRRIQESLQDMECAC